MQPAALQFIVPATLLEFAQVNDVIARTSSRLQKQAVLAQYLRGIDDDADLRLAVRFAAGRAFAATDERVLGASGAIVSDAILSILQIQPDAFWSRVVEKGEIGEALSELWHTRGERKGVTAERVVLREIADAFEDIASTGSQQRKRELVRALLPRCGESREAAYLAKVIFSDLRTGVREGVLLQAIAEAFGRDGDAVRRAQLLVGDLAEVAVLARHDRLGEAKFRLFHPVQFMLASPQETADAAAATLAGRSVLAEDKLDGIRAQVHKQDNRVAIYTRTMDRIDDSFPDVVDSLQNLPGTFLLDGEIVPYRDGVVLPFAHIQKRLGRKTLTSKIIRENPAAFIAFDILYHNDELLMERPLRERRNRLESMARQSVLITRVTEVSTAQQINAAFCSARDCRNEGLVLKDPESLYTPGRRGMAWLKLKTHLPTFDCVVTAAEYGHGKRRGVLSDYTFAVWDRQPSEPDARLVNIGKAYSGVTDEQIAQLTKMFLDLSIVQRGHVHVVRPTVVLEIACDQIQESSRHESGYALRFPRIKRIRWDKSPEDADRLQRIVEIYHSVANTARGAVAKAAPTREPTLFDGL